MMKSTIDLMTEIKLSRAKLENIAECVEEKFIEIKREYKALPDVPSSINKSGILTAKLEMLAYVLGLLGRELPELKI